MKTTNKTSSTVEFDRALEAERTKASDAIEATLREKALAALSQAQATRAKAAATAQRQRAAETAVQELLSSSEALDSVIVFCRSAYEAFKKAHEAAVSISAACGAEALHAAQAPGIAAIAAITQLSALPAERQTTIEPRVSVAEAAAALAATINRSFARV
jgi:hypothetical protein